MCCKKTKTITTITVKQFDYIKLKLSNIGTKLKENSNNNHMKTINNIN